MRSCHLSRSAAPAAKSTPHAGLPCAEAPTQRAGDWSFVDEHQGIMGLLDGSMQQPRCIENNLDMA